MRHLRILMVITAMVTGLGGIAAQAEAATLPSFPLALPVAWGATVQAGGSHTHSSGVRSSVDLGALNGASIPVVAAANGTVTVKGTGGFSRCMVIIQHQNGWQTQYYHLRSIPSGLTNGQQVVAGQKIGMTAMPGSETCGRGTFRHVHFTLYRNGVEQPIHGLSLGGYTVHDASSRYCGYWTRKSDGAVVADARRRCSAVPRLVNNIVNPASLTARGIEGPSRSGERPAIAAHDTIDAASMYITEGRHTVNGRAWRTKCEPYSRTERCFTDIWATQVRRESGGYKMVEGWAWNNLTYRELPRSAWKGNPLGSTTTWTSKDGRKWKTECDTARTGRNGCRSWIYATTYAAKQNRSGRFDVTAKNQWVFNNIVRFEI